MDLSTHRKEYSDNGLRRKDLSPNPLQEFDKWIQHATHSDILEPNAMILSTVTSLNTPDSRTVLLKEYNEQGFTFYTNTESQKASQLKANPNVSLLFLWLPLERQIRITGTASKIPSSKAEKYFQSRPLESQIAAWTSPQSQIIDSRKSLENELKKTKERFNNQSPLPLPPHWGGYQVIPSQYEFWQGSKNRLHDRFCYSLNTNHWTLNRLAP